MARNCHYNEVKTSLKVNNMQAFINQIDRTDRSVRRACVTGMRAGAKIIQAEQKRLILARPNKDGTSPTALAELIKVDKRLSSNSTYDYKEFGTYRIFIGYDKEAIKKHPEALVIEFGRPSLCSSKNVKFQIEQTRNGKKVKVINGYIPSYSHIRRAWDNKIAEAAQAVIDSIDKELKDFGYGDVDAGGNLAIDTTGTKAVNKY